VVLAAATLASSSPGGDFQDLDARGQAHFDMKEYEPALDLWRRALAVHPDSTRTRVKIGTALTRLQRYREAEAVFREGLALEPRNAMILYHLGALFLHEGRHEPARQHILLALQSVPWYPGAHYLLGYMLEKEGRYKEAADEYVAELRYSPADPNAWYHLLDLQKQGKVGRNWDRKVEWTPGKIIAVSFAITVGLGIFILAQVKAARPHAAAGQAPVEQAS